MSRIHRATIAIVIAILATAGALASAPAQADASVSQACRDIQVTGGKVAIRDFAFTNGLNIRTVRRGTVLRSCGLVTGGGYFRKCGVTDNRWFKVISGRVTVTGSRFGFVAASCARTL